MREILSRGTRMFEPTPYDDHPYSDACVCGDCGAWRDAKQDKGDRDFHEWRDGADERPPFP